MGCRDPFRSLSPRQLRPTVITKALTYCIQRTPKSCIPGKPGHYNQPVVRPLFSKRVVLFLATVVLWSVFPALSSLSQQPSSNTGSADAASMEKGHGRLLLVLPFDNRSQQTSLDWIGEAMPEVLNRRLSSAGFMPIERGDRQYALDHLGLPKNFGPSRATAIRLAQNLDADYVVVGSFTEQGSTFRASAQILDVKALRLGQPIVEQAEINHLLDVLNSLAWRVARTLDPKYAVAENTFVAAGSALRLDGFENYIRGLVEANPPERIRHLKDAVQQNPTYYPAWLALGMAYFGEQQFEPAANALGHLPKTDPNALQAEFYRGLAYFYTGYYPRAEEAFAFVATQLPLPEVVNNEGVVASRRNRDGVPFFQQAIAADPHDPDYRFNVAVAQARKGDFRAAMDAVKQAIKLRPQDTEAIALENTLRTPPPVPPPNIASSVAPAAPSTPGADGKPADAKPAAPTLPTQAPPARYSNLPLERIKRNFNDASFRQAASAIEEVQALRMATLPPSQQAAALTREGDHYLNQGLLLEAEREFLSALGVDSGNAGAHGGLAVVRQRDGDTEAARQEAQASVKLKPNAQAYVVLAQIDKAMHQNDSALANAEHALQLEPSNATARSLKQTLQPPPAPAPPVTP